MVSNQEELFKARIVYGFPHCIIQFGNLDTPAMVTEWNHIKKLIDKDLGFRMKQYNNSILQNKFEETEKSKRSGIN